MVNEEDSIRLWCRYQRTVNSFATAVPAARTGQKLPWFSSGAKQDAQGKKVEVDVSSGEESCFLDGWQLIERYKRLVAALNLNGEASLSEEADSRGRCRPIKY